MFSDTFEVILTITALSFWILFPLGMFISVSHVDKNTDQIIRFNSHRHFATHEYEESEPTFKLKRPEPNYHGKNYWLHAHFISRRWIKH
jgi:hypothetical protein